MNRLVAARPNKRPWGPCDNPRSPEIARAPIKNSIDRALPQPKRGPTRFWACIALVLGMGTAAGCGRRDASQSKPRELADQKDPNPAAAAASPDPSKTATPATLLEWLDSRSATLLLWRAPLRDASLLTDLFAIPARAAGLYQSSQSRIEALESMLQSPLHNPEMLAYRSPDGTRSLTVIRSSPSDYQKIRQRMESWEGGVTMHHEWPCVQPSRSSVWQLCALDAPDLAWVHRRQVAQDLDALRQARDLPGNARVRSIQKTWSASPAPQTLLYGYAPSLHLELDEDPLGFEWSLFSFGNSNKNGEPGWRGELRMMHSNPALATKVLKEAKGLEDNPRAKALRARAHIGELSEQALEIRLEVHGDDPAIQ